MLPPPALASALAQAQKDGVTDPVAAAAIATMTAVATIGVHLPPPAASTLSALATMTAAMATASSSPGAPGESPEEGSSECRLLGPFALVVQLALGALALLSLVYKRWRERPQRPIQIWFFDVSKQVFGAALVHVANVFMSILTSGRLSIKLDPATVQAAARLMARTMGKEDDGAYRPNPCSFYLLNLAIDVRNSPFLVSLGWTLS